LATTDEIKLRFTKDLKAWSLPYDYISYLLPSRRQFGLVRFLPAAPPWSSKDCGPPA